MSAVEREIGMARLERALPVIESVAHVAEQDILVTAAEKYTVLRRFTPRFLDAFRFQSSTPNDPVLAAVELLRTTRHPRVRQTAARVLPVAAMAQADLRIGRGRPPPLRGRRPRDAARPAEGQRHLGGRQPRLPRLRGLPAAVQTRRTRTGSAARPTPIAMSPRAPRCCTTACNSSRPAPRRATWTAWRSRRENSTSRAPSRRHRRPRARLPPASKACCRGCGSPRSWPTSTPGRGSPTASPICAPATRPPTSRRCSPPSSPTARIWACRAWPTRRAA